MGLPHQEQPLFSGKFGLFRNPKVISGPSPPILLIYKGFLSHFGKPFPALGTNLGQRSIFFSAILGIPNNSPNFPAASRSPYQKYARAGPEIGQGERK